MNHGGLAMFLKGDGTRFDEDPMEALESFDWGSHAGGHIAEV